MIKNIKKDKKVIKSQKGFALVEVIAALGISALVITALISLSISTLRTSLDSELLLEGTKVANREIELVRAYRDGTKLNGEARSWEEFISEIYTCTSDFPCSMDTNTGEVIYPHAKSYNDQGTAKELVRSFIITDLDGNGLFYNPSDPSSIPSVIRVSVSVNWKVGDTDKGSYIYTDLSNWRGR